MALITVRFYGGLKSFGTQFKLDVRDAAEAIRALTSQLPGLRKHLQQGYYKLRIGKDYILSEALEQGLFYCLKNNMSLHITPVIAGAKAGFQIIVGAALIAASFIPGLNVAVATGLLAVGASMALGGVAQMLTKTPSMGDVGRGKDSKRSTSFGGTQNMAAQGRPVPLAYGRIRCGSMIISQGIETQDVLEA